MDPWDVVVLPLRAGNSTSINLLFFIFSWLGLLLLEEPRVTVFLYVLLFGNVFYKVRMVVKVVNVFDKEKYRER